MLVLTGGRVLRPGRGRAEPGWVAIEDATIAGVGAGEPPPADRVVDVDGGVLVPAFCDAHVHLPATGLYAGGMDFRGEISADRIIEAFARRAEEGAPVLFGGNFEDPLDRPLTRHDLDRAVGERPALLARADMHSCVVSSALLEGLDLSAAEGVDRDADGAPTGYLRERAAAGAWTWLDSHLTGSRARAVLGAAVERAYSRGVAEVHEMHVVEWRGWEALDAKIEVYSAHDFPEAPGQRRRAPV